MLWENLCPNDLLAIYESPKNVVNAWKKDLPSLHLFVKSQQ